jgi:hypothetical protein
MKFVLIAGSLLRIAAQVSASFKLTHVQILSASFCSCLSVFFRDE